MTIIRFKGKSLPIQGDETVLDCIERHGMFLTASCRSGVCQSCMLKAVRGVVPDRAAVGLKVTLRQKGYLLACVCRPVEDLVLDACDAAPTFETSVLRVHPFSRDVFGVWLRRPAEFDFEAGQFLHVSRQEDGLTRPYSIACTPESDEIELHVRLVQGGRMSNWLRQSALAHVRIRGPFGDCHYVPTETERPLVLAGTGTGLAPLLGVVRAALEAGHRGPIRLYHGARSTDGLYQAELLQDLAERHPVLTVRMSVTEPMHGAAIDGCLVCRIDRVVFDEIPDLSAYRVYLCGNPDVVQAMKRKAYLAGAPLDHIHSDPFVLAPVDALR